MLKCQKGSFLIHENLFFYSLQDVVLTNCDPTKLTSSALAVQARGWRFSGQLENAGSCGRTLQRQTRSQESKSLNEKRWIGKAACGQRQRGAGSGAAAQRHLLFPKRLQLPALSRQGLTAGSQERGACSRPDCPSGRLHL